MGKEASLLQPNEEAYIVARHFLHSSNFFCVPTIIQYVLFERLPTFLQKPTNESSFFYRSHQSLQNHAGKDGKWARFSFPELASWLAVRDLFCRGFTTSFFPGTWICGVCDGCWRWRHAGLDGVVRMLLA